MKNIGFLSHLDLTLYLFRLPIMKALIKKGYKVYAICPKGDKNQALKDNGCIVINYEIQRNSLNPFLEKKAIDNIYEKIKDLKLDLLHTFMAKPNIYGTFAAKKAKIPVILNSVEGLGSFYIKNSIKNILIRNIMEYLYKKAFKISNGCVFVNTSDPEYMINKKIINKNKVKIIKSVGVDIEKFSLANYTEEKINHIKKTLNVENKIIILMVGRAIWDKGVREFYESAKILKKHYNDIEFIFVGAIDKGNHSCVSEDFLKNGCVKWLGHRDDIADITAISDIYVLPSYYKEGLPATLMEACSMSKPIVTTNAVGCKDVVDDGKNGFLVPIKDINELSKKIEILIKDKNLRYKMGQESLKKAINEFDVREIVKKYLEYYEAFI